MNTNHKWTTFHQQYPKAQLEYYRYEAHDYVGPKMLELEVFKMLQVYGMSARFKGTELQTLKGAQVTPIAVAAVKRVRPFLFRLLN